MEKVSGRTNQLFVGLASFLRKFLFKVLSVGPIPRHIAFIMDGNRRYAKKTNSAEGAGHRAGHSSLVSALAYCYEMGVKYATVYAFSIDNFKRRPEEVQSLMALMQEKIEELLESESIVSEYGTRVYFIGNLKLLSEPVRLAAEKAMKATAENAKTALLICIAYTSCDEIVHAVEQACEDKRREVESLVRCRDDLVIGEVEECGREKKVPSVIKLVDVERQMYMAVAPDPDILIRSSGESRLSNFLLWQTRHCPLYSTAALWPELGLWHLVWAVLDFQRSYKYLEKKKKKM